MFTLRQYLGLITAVVVILSALVTSAQPRGRGQPLIVRFTGTFQPFDQKAAGNLNTLTLSYQKRQWLFHVDRVNVLNGRDPGTLLLKNIVPPRLSLSGPAQLLEPLGTPESPGKQFTLEGMLYLRNRRFNVTTVKEETSADH
ncbi:MAG: hypothetical protein HY268_27045 [Deltaproteobacteria bacterium]|nr:hypothetical protein [Deltaproteobacteria bacterium]